MKNEGSGKAVGIEVLFRKAAPISDPEARYPGFNPSTTILKKGSVHGKEALPLPCDILFERDVPVALRDGTVIHTDIFRPVGGTGLPAIIAWSPYGKGYGWFSLNRFPGRMGVPSSALSGLEKFEGPDPAYWCNHGYVIVNPDSRGAFMSQGDIQFWGTQEAQDGYDLVEWVAAREWSSGKVSLSGNSWLAISQWFIAALQPPHLAAIAPWEGLSDFYREHGTRGGIPDTGFNDLVMLHLYGNNRIEDLSGMIRKYPMMNSYWEGKAADLERIEVPAYVVASWTNELHTHGTFEGFRRLSSEHKWLRVHNTHEWFDYYASENVDDLRLFFDRYLKGIENGWEQTPRVRLSVLDPGGIDRVNRSESEFPLARTCYQPLCLDASTGRLSAEPVTHESVAHYRTDSKGQAAFTIQFNQDTELTGYMKLRLWVEADGADDMDLFAFVQKLDGQGNFVPALVLAAPNFGSSGRLRVSHRQLDLSRSTPPEPYLTHTAEELLTPEQIVAVEIAIWPTAMLWHAGEQLRVIVAGHNLAGRHIPGLPEPKLRNKGDHIIHTGGKYDSYLLVPKIPR
jgi:hypothetical protein